MAAAGYKKSGKDQEAALDKALKSADYLASRGADGIAALKDWQAEEGRGTTLPKGGSEDPAARRVHELAHEHVPESSGGGNQGRPRRPGTLSGDPPIHTAVAWGRPESCGLSTGQGRNAKPRCRGPHALTSGQAPPASSSPATPSTSTAARSRAWTLSLREGGRPGRCPGAADENGTELPPKAKLPSYSNGRDGCRTCASGRRAP